MTVRFLDPSRRAAARIGMALLYLLLAGGCSNRALFSTLDAPAPGSPPPPARIPRSIRAARLVENRVVDSYYHPKTTSKWIEQLKAMEADSGPQPLGQLYRCLWQQLNSGDVADCYGEYFKRMFPILEKGDYELREGDFRDKEDERDSIRLVSNLASSGQDLLYLADESRCVSESCDPGADPLKSDLSLGIMEGLDRAAARLDSRSWHRRTDRPTTAIVLSGGAADGAFFAGYIWALLGAYEKTPDQPPVDLLVGTSSGSLVGAVLDAYFTPGATGDAKAEIRQFLFTGYTASHEADLLCIAPGDGAAGMFLGDTQGLVRFDPLEDKLRAKLVSQASISNPTEYVTMSVDLRQGTLWADSDQDPKTPTPDERIQSILASVVEPALAMPVLFPRLSDPQALNMDGGVRSGLPILEAARRGAERVLAFSASSLDPPPAAQLKNGGMILFRTIDLFVDQSRISEANAAEDYALVRRTAERQVCEERYSKWPSRMADVCGLPEQDKAVRSGLRPLRRPKVRTTTMSARGRPTADIGETWKSDWVFRPETAGASAVNYQFIPAQMQVLFEAGVRDFGQRCEETLTTLGFRDPEPRCSPAGLKSQIDVMEAQFTAYRQSHTPDVAPKIPACKAKS